MQLVYSAAPGDWAWANEVKILSSIISNRSISPNLDAILTSTTSLGLSGPENNGKEGLLFG